MVSPFNVQAGSESRMNSCVILSDVLTELPAKVRQVIEVPANGASQTLKKEQQAAAAGQERLE